MPPIPPADALKRLKTGQNIWFASVRADHRPHLVPVWYVYHDELLYISTDPHSVKIRNIQANPGVVLALEDGVHPVICEGAARILVPPYASDLLAAFKAKYEWDVPSDPQYHQVVQITPQKWLAW